MAAEALHRAFAEALGVESTARVRGTGSLRSAWAVDALASASVAAFGDAVSALIRSVGGGADVEVDRGLVGTWFRQALTPVGWALPSPWDPIAGDYRAADAWIRLHTNAPRHRAAALRVLQVPADRDAVAAAVLAWRADELESAVVAAGGAAARMRSAGQWAVHPQGRSVAAEPLVAVEPAGRARAAWRPDPARPLAGIRVLDVTRVLAGPVATRALAAYGATVLRIDPPDWDEPALVPDMTLGKRTARLDATTAAGRSRLTSLLADADVLVHGFRRDALDGLGLGEAARHGIRPGLVEVALTAYGWTGPWSGRRGFDSLVQMSAGIADHGMRASAADHPVPLPVQALDHATGWLMAAAAVSGLRGRLLDGHGSIARLSLARTAAALAAAGPSDAADPEEPGEPGEPEEPRGEAGRSIRTPWGAGVLAPPPLAVGGAPFRFDAGPVPLGAHPADWAA